MPRFELVPAKPFHCGQMARLLRREQANAFIMLGLDVHKELRLMLDSSYMAQAWLIDGKLAGLGGVWGSQLAGAGYLWLALSRDAVKYPLAIVKEVTAQLEALLQDKHTLTVSTVYGDPAARRLVSWLGFDLHKVNADCEIWIMRRQQREAA